MYLPLKIKSFVNRHEGETCYIFGDGPSIKSFDYSNFTDHISICCGMQIFHRDFNKLNVKYYSLIEPYLFYPDWIILTKKYQYLKKHRIITNEFKNLMKLNNDITFFLNLSNIFTIYLKNICFLHKYKVKNIDAFKLLMSKNINPFVNSFNTVISIARLMGFKKIYLIGFDSHTIKNTPYRWYESNTKASSHADDKIDYDLKEIVFMNEDILDIYGRDMEIVNISNEGTNCNVTHMDYSKYTGEKIENNTNVNLINPKYMGLLKKRFESI